MKASDTCNKVNAIDFQNYIIPISPNQFAKYATSTGG